MKKETQFAATARPFVFELDQLVDVSISDEWGQVKARAQYTDSENQYLIHYQAADKCARTNWFSESMLVATEDDRYPGCPVFAPVELPEGAIAS